MSRSGMILSALALILPVTPASGGGWHIGGVAGVNSATFGGEFGDIVDPDPRNALTAGVRIQRDLAGPWALVTGMVYAPKGGSSEGQLTDPLGNPGGTYTSEWQFRYLEIPLLAKLSPSAGTGIRPFLLAGPSVGISMGGRFVSGIGRPFDQNLHDFRPFDLGIAGGAGLEFPIGGGTLGLEARYTGGLFDLYDLDDNAESRNSVFSFVMFVQR